MRGTDSLSGFFFVIRKRKYLISGVAIAVLIGTIFGTYIFTPTYMAESRILVDINPKQQLILFPDLNTPTALNFRIDDLCQNAIQILSSKSIAEEIVKKYGLDKRLEERETEPKEWRYIITKKLMDIVEIPRDLACKIGLLEEEKIDYFSEAVTDFMEDAEDIEQESGTSVVVVKIWEESPDLSSSIANTMVELLKEKILLMGREETETAYRFTNQQLSVVKENLIEAEDQLDLFRKENKTLLVTDEQRAMIQRLNTLEAELDNLNAQLAASLPEKTSFHPDIIELKAQIKEKETSLDRETQKLLLLPRTERELIRLTRTVDTYEKLTNNLSAKLEELKVQKINELGELRVGVIDKAYLSPDAEQDFPDWKLIIGVSFVVALLVGVGCAFLVEYCNDTFYTVEEIEKLTNLPILGTVPKFWVTRQKSKK